MPKLSPPIEGAASAFADSSSAVSSSWLRKPSTSIPSLDTPSRRWSRADRQRVGADQPQPRAGRRVHRRPRAQQHLQPLPRLVPADERDAVLAVGGVGLGRNQDAVRDDVVRARKPARSRVARLLRDRDPVVDPVHQRAPEVAARSASSRARPRRGRWRRRDSARTRAQRRRSRASSARAGGGRRTARARARA